MGNSESTPADGGGGVTTVRREESFGSKSPAHSQRIMVVNKLAATNYGGSAERITVKDRLQRRVLQGSGGSGLTNRSQSLEQSGLHSPTSSRSSSSNSYVNCILNGYGPGFSGAGERTCLRLVIGSIKQKSASTEEGAFRKSAQPKFQICGDLTSHQINIVKREWKKVLKSVNEDETEVATRLLLRIFELDERNQDYFFLAEVPFEELRDNALFTRHVKTIEPVLVHVMTHLSNATSLSKHLQQLGGRHVQYTSVTYKSSYWKNFVQALVDVMGADHNADVFDAFTVLGAFCVEQMRIGYRIEFKLQAEAEKITRAQQKRRAQLATNIGAAAGRSGSGGSEKT